MHSMKQALRYEAVELFLYATASVAACALSSFYPWGFA